MADSAVDLAVANVAVEVAEEPEVSAVDVEDAAVVEDAEAVEELAVDAEERKETRNGCP